MLWKVVAGCVLGGVASASFHHPQRATLALQAPTLDVIMDASKDVVPIRAVVVGGGYAGSRLAYQLDSLFNVTFIDEKNFFELTNDIIPILTNPWDEDKHTEACRRMMVLHRYYLKRTNVLTGTVDGVDYDNVYLQDGRKVPYDLLFVATGERKPFPFGTQQRTLSGRVQELKHFNTFLQSCKKIAVVGGGPVGTSLAYDLATARSDTEVHLFHSRSELVPRLPGECRRYATEAVSRQPNLHLHLCSRVNKVTGLDAKGNVCDTVSAPSMSAAAGAATPHPAAEGGGGGTQRWGRALLSSLGWGSDSANAASITTTANAVKYAVGFEQLRFEPQPQQSVLSQIYFGRLAPHDDSDAAVVAQAEEGGFDYVFSVCGDTPRPVVGGSRKPNILKDHETPEGHYRTSTLLQLFGHPTIFAAGRCTNLPVVKGYGSSDTETRTIFRELNRVISSPKLVFLNSGDGVNLTRMSLPRQSIRLGPSDGIACTPWSGGMSGAPAVHEFMQDRNYLMKDFMQPVFFKQFDQLKVRTRMKEWMESEVTDITDFSHS